MADPRLPKPRYGTWIRTRKLVFLWLVSVASLLLTIGLVVIPDWHSLPRAWLIVVAAGFGGFGLLMLYIAFIVSLTAWRFSPAGGDWQGKAHQLILSRLAELKTGNSENARGLDIGCGSGKLVIQAAGLWPGIGFTGLDFWGNDWEYSAEQCRRNALWAGRKNLQFVPGSAAGLPFDSASFDLVVSCLTFHEVQGIPDRTVCLTEAVRVLKPGGAFVFLDLFDDPKYYPDQAGILGAIHRAGAIISETLSVDELIDLPYPLRGNRALGRGRLISGRKS